MILTISLISIFFSWGRMLSLRQQRIFVLCAVVRRVLATRVVASTGWFQISCVRVVISPTTTVLVANLFMVRGSKTRTSNWLIPSLVYSLWQMLVPTPTAANSLSPAPRPVGLMENMLCLEKLPKAWMLLEKYVFAYF